MPRATILMVLAAGSLGACAGAGSKVSPPCHEGWLDGVSTIWTPPTGDAGLPKMLQGRGRLACIHKTPGGELVAVSVKGSRVLTTTLVVIDGVYVVTDTGAVVSARH